MTVEMMPHLCKDATPLPFTWRIDNTQLGNTQTFCGIRRSQIKMNGLEMLFGGEIQDTLTIET